MNHTTSGISDEQLFLGLVADLVNQAWISLGKLKNPTTDELERNVPAAAMMIDMLDMLVRKTEGRRNAAEDQLLSESLKQLKLNYVAESSKADVAEHDEPEAEHADQEAPPSANPPLEQENNDGHS